MGTTEDKFDDSKEFLWGIRVGIWSIFYVQYQDSIKEFLMQNYGENIFSSQLGITVYMQIVKAIVVEQ